MAVKAQHVDAYQTFSSITEMRESLYVFPTMKVHPSTSQYQIKQANIPL
jgi:hypothetical protein